MITAGNVRKNASALETRAKRSRDQKVIQPPTDIPRARRAHRTPPRVMAAALFKFPERIHKTRVHESVKTGAFFGSEAMVLHIGLGIREINLRMRHVQVTAPHDRLFSLQHLEKFQEIPIPLLPILEPRQLPLGIGGVNIDEEEILILGGENPAFLVMFRDREMRRDFQRPVLREDRGAGVALFHSAIPISRVMRGPELFDLLRRTLGLLETEDVWFLGGEEFEKILFQHSPQAVHVPGNELHGNKKSAGRPLHFSSAQDVTMQMGHGLASIRPVIEHEAVPGLFKAKLLGHRSGLKQ